MKRLVTAIIIVVGLLVFVKNDVYALVVGDEIMSGNSYTAIPFSKFQIGGVGEFVFDKELDTDDTSNNRSIEGFRFLVKPTISVFENVDLYAKLGVGRDKFDDGDRALKVDSDMGFSYGGGLRANLINLDDIGVHMGMDAQYLALTTGIDSVTVNSIDAGSSSGDFTMEQWQVAVFLVKTFFQATIYAGGDYSDCNLSYEYDTGSQTGSGKAANDKVMGVFAGMNVYLADNVIFFAEGHLIDEKSLSLGVNARF